jgi:chemotaxis signal transduction protein
VLVDDPDVSTRVCLIKVQIHPFYKEKLIKPCIYVIFLVYKVGLMNDNLGGPQAIRLVLGLTGRRVVADVAATTEVLPGLPWVELPGLKPWMRGVAVHQSNLLPVVDLSGILDAQPLLGSGDKQRIVSVSSGGFRTGFLVASVDAVDEEGEPNMANSQDLETIGLNDLCLDLLADPRSHLANSVHD